MVNKNTASAYMMLMCYIEVCNESGVNLVMAFSFSELRENARPDAALVRLPEIDHRDR